MTEVTVWHNISTDNVGRLLGMLDGYQPGHALVPVHRYHVDSNSIDWALNEAYQCFNVGDDPTFGTPDPRAVKYRQRKNRSLSVGDVISLTSLAGKTTWFACASVGWDEVVEPTAFAIGATRHGTTSLDEDTFRLIPTRRRD